MVDDWILRTLQPCSTDRRVHASTQHPGTGDRSTATKAGSWAFAATPLAPQIEAIVVVGNRAYLFTLFDNPEMPNADEARALFDEARRRRSRSIRQSAGRLAEPEPVLTDGPQSGNASGPRSLSSRASPEASSAGSQEYG